MKITPKDIIPDGKDSINVNGVEVRKGSVGAFLANIRCFEDPDTSDADKEQLRATLKELAPSLIAIGLHHHVIFKNQEIQHILDDIEKIQGI